MIEETETPKTIEETQESNTPEETENDEIEEAFQRFNEANSEQKAEEPQGNANDSDPTEIDLSQAENFKLQIFISLMFTLLDGLHVFVYGFISKYKITRDDIGLDENDKQGLEMYFKTQRVMDMINRLPVEIIGFLHIEYMYFNKFQEFNKKMKASELEEEEQETEEEEEEETIEDKILRKFDEKKSQFESKNKSTDANTSVVSNDVILQNQKATKKEPSKKVTPKKSAPKKATKKEAPKKVTPEEKK